MPYTSHGHAYGVVDTAQPRPPVARCGGPGLCRICSREVGMAQPARPDTTPAEEAPPGEPAELASLPVEVRAPVRALVHAVDQMRDHWAEADEARRRELWQQVHRAHDAVWGITVAVALARARV